MNNFKLSALALAVTTLFTAISVEAASSYVFRKHILNLKAEPANQHAVLSASPGSLSFPDTTELTQSAGQVITVSNTGSASLIGLSSGVTGDFTATTDCGTSLAVGATCTITPRFAPQSAGAKSGSVAVSSTNGGSASVSLSGSGLSAAAPAIGLTASGYSNGTMAFGTSTALVPVTVTNTGNANLVFGIQAITITGTNSADFIGLGDTCSSHSIAPKGTCEISVKFNPTATGARVANLNFADNASGSPQVVTLTGTGTAAAFAITSPTGTQTFNSATVGASATPDIAFTLTNSGNVAGSPATSTLSGTDSTQFSILSDTCSTPVAGGGTCLVTVRFTPTSTGAKTATLNAGSSSVTLNGSGADLSGLTLNFENSLLNESSGANLSSSGTISYAAGVSGQALSLNGSSYVYTTTMQPVNNGDFTVEGWIKSTVNSVSGGASRTIFRKDNYDQVYLSVGSGNLVYGWGQITSPTSLTDGNWHYFAVSKQSGTARMYVDGAFVGSVADGTNHSSTTAYVGSYNGGHGFFSGLLDGIKYTNSAVYTSTSGYAPPADPFFSSVTLLIHGDGLAGGNNFSDVKGNTVTGVGSSQFSATNKWGSGSIQLSGSSVSIPDSTSLRLGAGDFTVEGWVNSAYNSATLTMPILSQYDDAGSAGSWILGIQSNKLIVFSGGTSWTGTTTVNDGIWHHIAFTRSGSSNKVFIDGVQNISFTDSTNYGIAYPLQIGRWGSTVNASSSGYFDDIRVTKGVARYTANFTAPTAAFPNQ